MNFFVGASKLLFKSWRFLPKGGLSLFIFITFFIELFTKGFSYAMTHLATSILGAELIINRNVKLAVQNLPDYSLLSFVEIVSSVLVLYYLIKFITAFLVGFSGSQARWSSMIVSILIVGIIEISVISIVDNHLGFIPIKDGLWYLVTNIQPVLLNIHFF